MGSGALAGPAGTEGRLNRASSPPTARCASGLAAVAAVAETSKEREEQLVREPLRDSQWIARRVDLDEVEAHDLVAAAEVEKRIHHLPRRQATRHGRARTRRVRELDAVDVERDVDAVDAAGRDLPRFREHRIYPSPRHVSRREDRPALLLDEVVAVVLGVDEAGDTDLHDVARVDSVVVLDDSADRCPVVRSAVVEVLAVDVSIELDEPDALELGPRLVQRAHDWPRHRMVAADEDRKSVV